MKARFFPHTKGARCLGLLGIILLALGSVAEAAVDATNVYSGNATYYTTEFPPPRGQCDLDTNEVPVFFAAINGAQYGNSEWCGAWVEVTGPGGTAVVKIIENCPECGFGDLDFGFAAYMAVTGDDGTLGRVPITWRWVSAPGEADPLRFYSSGSNPFFLLLQAGNPVNPISTMEILISDVYTPMTRTSFNHFQYPGTYPSTSFTVRVTDIFGNSIVTTGLNLANTEVEGVGQSGTENFPPLTAAPNIVVEQPVGTVLDDGSTQDFVTTFAAGGSPPVRLTFTIRNTGAADLTGLIITKDGADPGDFIVTASPTSPVVPNGTTTFTVEFAPATGGTKASAIHIANNATASGKDPYDIQLTGHQLSAEEDTDADGMNDAAELRLSGLGFDWQVKQDALVSLYYESANVAGLYSQSQVQALHPDALLLARDPVTGKFTLTLRLEKSTNLLDFTTFPFSAPDISINGTGHIEFRFTPPGNAAFFRLGAE